MATAYAFRCQENPRNVDDELFQPRFALYAAFRRRVKQRPARSFLLEKTVV